MLTPDLISIILELKHKQEWKSRKDWIHNLLDLTIIPIDTSISFFNEVDDMVFASVKTNFLRITRIFNDDLGPGPLYLDVEFTLKSGLICNSLATQ